MRSRRYKYMRHCATDCLVSHIKAGYHVYGAAYTFKGPYGPFEYYYLKHCDSIFRICRHYHVYVDIDGIIFPKRFKNRCGPRYEIYNMNHDY